MDGLLIALRIRQTLRLVSRYEKLTHYINGAVDGEHYVYCFDFLRGVRYPKGQRDILVFICLRDDKKTPQMDLDGNPRFCGIVMNHSKGKSGKAKINKVKRFMLTAKDGLSLKDSFKNLPPIDYFLREIPLKVFITNKELNGNRVANIVRMYSDLYGKNMYIKQRFDGESAIKNSEPIT